LIIKGEVTSNRVYAAKNYSSLERVNLQNYLCDPLHQLITHENDLVTILGTISFLEGKIFITEEKNSLNSLK
jgi:hypothetical protein